jgi:hypothetical protein
MTRDEKGNSVKYCLDQAYRTSSARDHITWLIQAIWKLEERLSVLEEGPSDGHRPEQEVSPDPGSPGKETQSERESGATMPLEYPTHVIVEFDDEVIIGEKHHIKRAWLNHVPTGKAVTYVPLHVKEENVTFLQCTNCGNVVEHRCNLSPNWCDPLTLHCENCNKKVKHTDPLLLFKSCQVCGEDKSGGNK